MVLTVPYAWSSLPCSLKYSSWVIWNRWQHRNRDLLRGTGVDKTYHLTELRDADLDKVDWPAVVEGVQG